MAKKRRKAPARRRKNPWDRGARRWRTKRGRFTSRRRHAGYYGYPKVGKKRRKVSRGKVGTRSAAARKAARTRAAKHAARSAAARKAVRTRAARKRSGHGISPRAARSYRSAKQTMMHAVPRANPKRRRRRRGGKRRTYRSRVARRAPIRRRRRAAPRRRYRARRVRRNPGIVPKLSLKGVAGIVTTGAAAYFGANIASNIVNRVLGFLPIPIPTMVQSHMPVLTAGAAWLLADQATRRVKVLKKYRTPILIGASILVAQRVYSQYVARFVPAQLAQWITPGVGQIPAFWQHAASPYQGTSMQDYLMVQPGVGLGQLHEAAADYLQTLPGVGEYVGAAPGMQGIHEAAADVYEAAAGMLPSSYEGARIMSDPVGQMPIPRTMTPGEAAFDSQEAGGGGIFGSGPRYGGGIFDGAN